MNTEIRKPQSQPQAGWVTKTPDSELTFTYLAPLPLPVGIDGFSSHHLHMESNEVYLDISTAPSDVEPMGLGSQLAFWFAMIPASLAAVIAYCCFAAYRIYENSFNVNKFIRTLDSSITWAAVGLIASMVLVKCLYIAYKFCRRPPMRFNRQKREVAYMTKRGGHVSITPWEEVIACVGTTDISTELGTFQYCELRIGVQCSVTSETLWHIFPMVTFGSALAEWEAIRLYMEEGRTEESEIASFKQQHTEYRENYWYPQYLICFVIPNFLTFWTLPIHLASWIRSLSKKGFPQSVIAWSKSTPPDQRKGPSTDLQKQSGSEVLKNLHVIISESEKSL